MSVRILTLDTSSDYGSAAISYGDAILSRTVEIPNQNSVWMLPLIEALLAEAGCTKTQLDAVGFGRGPGSFTGIRLATNLAQAIAFARNIPVIPISTLQTLAQQAWREHQCRQVLAALDARLNQVYWGCYQYDLQSNLMKLWGEERLDGPQQVEWLANSMDWKGIGSGWDHYQQYLQGEWIADSYPKAYDMANIARHEYKEGHAVSGVELQPVYLRNQVAHVASQ